MTKHQRLFTHNYQTSTFVEIALQNHLNYAKQTQFLKCNMNVSSAYTKDYEDNSRKIVMKKQTQFKPNFRKDKKKAFALIRRFIMIYCDFLADFITLKGANSKPITPAISKPATLIIDDYPNPAYNDNGNF
jgi:hypothetical protein